MFAINADEQNPKKERGGKRTKKKSQACRLYPKDESSESVTEK